MVGIWDKEQHNNQTEGVWNKEKVSLFLFVWHLLLTILLLLLLLNKRGSIMPQVPLELAVLVPTG